ncbi:transketolase [Paraburkholderia phenoliruptrix]|uniref:transketolase n=1 Tax=Paraburkholderia phenoliruptrix TaxID=252970 RepID=UPI002869C05F|nr:transketolase [Paraburkholderia phenoliruptrix]WMY11771.1 transketolase [Paraburkholderia phenoliruptrix]
MESNATGSLANAIRFLAIDSILKAGEGHQGVPLGMAEVATALFTRHLKFNPDDPLWPDRDRFVLSNGHGSLLLYSLLYLTGYSKISLEQLKSFRELGSHCAGHPEFDPAAGIEVTTGPLGQGIANALGMAIAEAHLRAKFGPDVIDHHTYAFVGDGCLQEGIGQEMISLAGHLKLGKLILCWDDNRITDDGSTDISISEDVCARFRVAGWHVIEVDGHDIEAVSCALSIARKDERPSMIACRTVIGKGLARLEGTRGGHSGKLFPSDAEASREALQWPHQPFEIPADILDLWRTAAKRSKADYVEWTQRVGALPEPERDEFKRIQQAELAPGWSDVIEAFKAHAIESGEPVATITSSGALSDLLVGVMPERMVACADLEAPTNHKRSLSAFTGANPEGSYVHCGVREHVMGALANGMAAHGGVSALSVTYLAFSDYERPAMRMAALMGLPVKFVFSHDSIGVGKNGPTHQPVEILASLRAMPNMRVFRPADATEVAECWALATEDKRGPSSMIFARQAVSPVRTHFTKENLSAKGAYVLAQPEGQKRHVTLIATGSEVQIAVEAAALLKQEGVECAVVSAPCFELFDEQPDEYRDAVLGRDCIRVGIEAAVRQGWDRYLGDKGIFVGMTGFGASGPAEQLYKHFGITAERVTAEVLARLK